MSNLNEQKNYSREVSQSTHNDATRTTETINSPSHDSYRSGYINGQASERLQEDLIERDNDNASRGLLVGILITALAALTGGAIWFFSQRDQSPDPVAPIVIPAPSTKPDSKPSPQASKAPEKTTIIEKTKEVLVPVPQPTSQSPAPRQDVNVTVPNPTPPSPAAQQAPTTAPTQPQTNSSPAQGEQSNTNSSTPEGEQSDTNASTSTPSTPEGEQSDAAPEGTSSQSDTTGSSPSSDSAN